MACGRALSGGVVVDKVDDDAEMFTLAVLLLLREERGTMTAVEVMTGISGFITFCTKKLCSGRSSLADC